MNRLCISVFVFFSCVIHALAQSPVTWIQLNEPQVASGMSFLEHDDPNDEPYSISMVKEGVPCRYIPSNYKYGYFFVDDIKVPIDSTNLIFKISYYDEGISELRFEYNATNNRNYQAVSIQKTNTKNWLTVTFVIEDASLRNAQNQGADFRINWDNYISRVELFFGKLDPTKEEIVHHLGGSTYSDISSKSVAGYQAWFSTGGQYDYWAHWGSDKADSDGTLWPRAEHSTFDLYPDVSDYQVNDLMPTGYATLGNGSPSQLYNASSRQVIHSHFEQMERCGIDGVAVQRFINPSLASISYSTDAKIHIIKDAAERHQRVFYITYDITSSGLEDVWDDLIRFDWVYNVERNYQLTQSPSYATMQGKPVVQLWGTGFTGNHPGSAKETMALIQWFKERGCYVIGGVPTYWRENRNDAKGPTQSNSGDKEAFTDVYLHYDMLSPWMVGRITSDNAADLVDLMQKDVTYCHLHSIDYLPVVYPGFSWGTWANGPINQTPRNAGQFLWNQITTVHSLGLQQVYFAMFDEYDEATALAKAATDWTMLPTDAYFLTTSADGIWCSSDFYLRLAGAATESLKATHPLTQEVPIDYSLGPIYYRNSFEYRRTPYNYQNHIAQNNGTFPIDPCFYQPKEISAVNMKNVTCSIEPSNARSGLYSMCLKGQAYKDNAQYIYCFTQQPIPIKEVLSLTAYCNLTGAGNVYLRIRLNDGSLLLSSPPSASLGWEKLSIYIDESYIGHTIIGIDLVFESRQPTDILVHVDDILIKSLHPSSTPIEQNVNQPYLYSQDGAIQGNDVLNIYDLQGRDVTSHNGNLPDGIYLIKTTKGFIKVVLH